MKRLQAIRGPDALAWFLCLRAVAPLDGRERTIMLHNPEMPDILISELADDPDMLELVELYVEELPDKVADLERTLEECDLDELARLAHQIKGSSGGYGFGLIAARAAVVEQSATDGAEPEMLQAQVRELIMLCLRARAKA